jgi:YggT family protein
VSVLVALTRNDIADYVEALFLVYLILIFARILLSWIPRLPYNRYLRAVVDFIHQVTDPFLNLFRRVLPPVGGRGFALDLSPIIAVVVLLIVQTVVVNLIAE